MGITFYMPEDALLRAAIGAVAIRHGQLDYVLRMTVKSLAELSVRDAIDATERDGSAKLREQIAKLARRRFGEGQVLLRLKAILTRCRRAAERRNELLHGLFARDLEGAELWRHEGHAWRALPNVTELEALVDEINDIAAELNSARLDGSLRDALRRHPLEARPAGAAPNAPPAGADSTATS